eukprot:scpid23865/ scgid16868/ Helicase POLQ-like; Mus308-like helicase; POLQ-like helicase
MYGVPRGKPLFKQDSRPEDVKQPSSVPGPAVDASNAVKEQPVLRINTKRKNPFSPKCPPKRLQLSADVTLTQMEMEGCLATGLISPDADVSLLLSLSGGPSSSTSPTVTSTESIATASATGHATGHATTTRHATGHGTGDRSQLLSSTGQWDTDYQASYSVLSASDAQSDMGASSSPAKERRCGGEETCENLNTSTLLLSTLSHAGHHGFTAVDTAPVSDSGADSHTHDDESQAWVSESCRASSPVLFESEDSTEPPAELQEGICPEEGDVSLSSSVLMGMLNEAAAEIEESDATGLLPRYSVCGSVGLQSSEHSQEDCTLIAADQSNTMSASATIMSSTVHCQTSAIDATNQAGVKFADAAVGSCNSNTGFFGLSPKVLQLLKSIRGIDTLYDWQTECLQTALSGRRNNWIFSMPTSGGKTLVAEVLMFTELLINRKDTLFIVPFVSIVQEKVRSLVPFAAELDFLVEEYAASQGRIPPRKRRKKQTMYIATIEKANAVITSLLEAGRLSSLGLVVVDELHMLGEGGSRGATLESSLSLLIHASPETWLVGMSATLSNIHQLQTFLSAQLFTSDFRPVKLEEHVMLRDEIFQVQGSGPDVELISVRKLNARDRKLTDVTMDPDCLVSLVLEAILDENKQPSHSCLIFCATKKSCQNVAAMLANVLRNRHKSILAYKSSQRRAVLKTLRNESAGECCPVLTSTVPAGVAYHHSGLTADERKVIEEAFSSDLLCVLCSTTTLAAGVNLPARRVILRCPLVGRSFLSLSQYKQMVGRAGRAGLDTTGNSILILQDKQAQQMLSVLQGPFASCESSLLSDGGKSFRRFLLSLIGLKVAVSDEDIQDVIGKTLWHVQCASECDFQAEITGNLQLLLKSGFIRRRPQPSDGAAAAAASASVVLGSTDGASQSQSLMASSATLSLPASSSCLGPNTRYYYRATTLGMATMKGSLDVSVAPIAYRDMLRSLRTISLSTDLHLLYLVTPVSETVNLEPDWMVFLREVSKLQTEEAHVASILGISDACLTQRATGRSNAGMSAAQEMVYRRFYLTLLLHHLLKERSVWDVAAMFSCSRGFVQNLMSSAASFASCLLHFTEGLKELRYVHILLPDIVRRLSFAVRAELIPLMEIPGIRQGRARQLHSAGFGTMQDVARSSVSNLLAKLAPIGKKQVTQILSAAKIALQEKVESLREEADDLLAASQASTSSE